MIKKEIKKNRIKQMFIDACYQIMSTSGIEKVTIRKIGELTGYNSATIYNYFNNLDHLMLYAACKYLDGYLNKLKTTDLPNDSRERYLLIWRLFAEEAFANPDYYYMLFFKFSCSGYEDTIRDYFSIYPDELSGFSQNIKAMLLESELNKRDKANLKQCVEEGYISASDASVINDMTVLIFQSLIFKAMMCDLKLVESAVEKMMDYLTRIFNAHLIVKKS